MRRIIIGILALFLLSCEGPVGPEGAQGPQGAEGPQGPRGISKVMIDHTVALSDYYQSTVTGDWFAGIEHDSIRVTSMIDVYINAGQIQFWVPILYLGEITNGRLGLFDPDRNLFLGVALRIIIIN